MCVVHAEPNLDSVLAACRVRRQLAPSSIAVVTRLVLAQLFDTLTSQLAKAAAATAVVDVLNERRQLSLQQLRLASSFTAAAAAAVVVAAVVLLCETRDFPAKQ